MDRHNVTHKSTKRNTLSSVCVGACLLAGSAMTAHTQMSIGVYGGQPGVTPNTSATVTHVCSGSIPLNGNTTTKELGANNGDGCAPAQILLTKPNSTQIDTFGQLYFSEAGNYSSNTDTGDAATYTTPVAANSYVGVLGGPGYTGELRVLYNGNNAALGTALIAGSDTTLKSPVATGLVYNVLGGGEYSSIGSGGGTGYTTIFASAYVATDGPGNIFAEGSSYIRMMYVAGAQQASFLAAGGATAGPAGTTAAKVGYSYVLVDSNTPGEGYFGDGGYVLASKFNSPRGMAVDASGNLYVADYGNNVVREINIAGASLDAMGNATQLGYVTGVVGGAGTGCAEASTSSGTSTACTAVESGDGGAARSANLKQPIDLAFDSYGNLYIADFGGRVRVVYLGTQPPAGFYATTGTSCNGSASSSTTGTLATCKDIYTYAGGGTSTTTGIATSIKLSSAAGIGFDSLNNLYIADQTANQIWLVTASTQQATIVAGGGSSTKEATCSTDGYGDGCIATNAVLSAPQGHISVDSQGYVYFADNGNNVVRVLQPYVQGTASQTITFPAPTSPVAYGAASITLAATSSSGLPVTYAVTGPATLNGSVLTYNGVGTVVITASQAGNAVYAAATSVQQSVVVNTATLTVSVSGTPSRIFGTANPAFGYTITGFISPDTQATTVSGAPVITTSAVPRSPAGSYPITPQLGTLTLNGASNYALAFATGTLIVTGSAAQSITFPALANYVDNGNTVSLVGLSTSGLPVTFSLTSGPAQLTGSTLTMAGLGAVTITASQPGNASFAAAVPVSRTFTPQATTFKVYDTTFYSGSPNLEASGLVRADVIYESLIWPNGASDTTLPSRSSFDTLMLNYTNSGPLVLDVEDLGVASTANEQILATLADWAHADQPGRIVGYYGYGTLDGVSSQNLPNAKALALHLDAMFPSLYTRSTDQGANQSADESSWDSTAVSYIAAARSIAPGKPVYAYVSPQYQTGTTPEAFLSSSFWSYELQTLQSLADGFDIWSSSSYAWSDTTGWWDATQAFMKTLQ